MARLTVSLFAALTLLTLAACAPTTALGSRSAPYRLDDDAIEVQPGGTVYLQQSYSFAQLEVRPQDLVATLWIPAGFDSEKSNAMRELALRDPRTPPRWVFDIAEADAVREFNRGGGALYTFDVLYRIAVPELTEPGRYAVRGTLTSRRGGQAPVAAQLRVRF